MKSRKIASKLGVTALTVMTALSSIGAIPVNAATNEQTIGINGTVKAISTLDITVPVQPLEFAIDSDGNFGSPAKTITNNTILPVYAYVTEVYGSSGNYPELVNSNTYADWSSIGHDETIAKMALQLNSNELSTIYQTDSVTKSDSANYIELGSIAADNGELNLWLSGNYGKAWNNAEDVNFSYTANMLFTTIEGNFGNGGSGGSGGTVTQSILTYVTGDGDIFIETSNSGWDYTGSATIEIKMSKPFDSVEYESYNIYEINTADGGEGLKSDVSIINGDTVTFTDENIEAHGHYKIELFDASGNRVGQTAWDDGFKPIWITVIVDGNAHAYGIIEQP